MSRIFFRKILADLLDSKYKMIFQFTKRGLSPFGKNIFSIILYIVTVFQSEEFFLNKKRTA